VKRLLITCLFLPKEPNFVVLSKMPNVWAHKTYGFQKDTIDFYRNWNVEIWGVLRIGGLRGSHYSKSLEVQAMTKLKIVR
jgi:hypothetical protein